MAKILSAFKQAYAMVVSQRDAATAEVERLKKALNSSEAEKARLTKRERELSQEVSMMAAAIDVANREIAEQDTQLLDAAVSVNADLNIAPAAAAAPAPAAAKHQVLAKAAAPVPANAAKPAAPTRQALPPASLPDSIDLDFTEIEQMIQDGLKAEGLRH